MTHTIKMFLKFGSLENIQDMFDNGTIYMNTIEYFRKCEDNNIRGDSYEGTSKIINSLPGTFRIPNVNRNFKFNKIHLKEAYPVVLGNLFCLYCISSKGFPNPLDFKFDERIIAFGTHCLLIKDNQYFLNAILKELQTKKYKFHHGFVEYNERDKISKELSLFEKPSEFDYQKEFRFYVHNDEVKPISIRIGSLHEKAEIYKTDRILTLKLMNNNGSH